MPGIDPNATWIKQQAPLVGKMSTPEGMEKLLLLMASGPASWDMVSRGWHAADGGFYGSMHRTLPHGEPPPPTMKELGEGWLSEALNAGLGGGTPHENPAAWLLSFLDEAVRMSPAARPTHAKDIDWRIP
jgi:hypothetical protein